MKVGFIGVGNMGGAILKGCLEKEVLTGSGVYVYTRKEETVKGLEKQYGVNGCSSTAELVKKSRVVLVGVKPVAFDTVLPQMAESYTPDKIVISMAAGISISYIEEYLGKDSKIVRIMPNTPVFVGEGMTSVSRNANVTDAELESLMEIFRSIGKAEEVDETLIHCVIGVSGSSPAYTYMYIDALAKAAEKNGMDRGQALTFAAQAVLGAAKMILETDVDPVQLRINVCSPGGTTIEAVNTLMNNGFEGNVAEAFQAAVEKSKIMTK